MSTDTGSSGSVLGPAEPSTPAAALYEALCADFPSLAGAEIAECIVEAHESVELFGLGPGEREAQVEVISRHLLAIRSGQVIPNARLDPERHDRKRTEPAD